MLRRRSKIEHRVANRCWVLWLATFGLSNVEIGEMAGMHRNSVSKIRNRFAKAGFESLEDASRPGKPPIHSAETKQKIVNTVLGAPPKGLSRWSTRTLARRLGLSKSFVHSVLVEYDLHPHRLQS